MREMTRIVRGLVVLVVLLSTSCGLSEGPTATPMPTMDYASIVSITGEVLPARRATLSAQTGGTVMEVLVEPGDSVTAGDVLIRLDPADAQLAVRRAEAALHAARSRLAIVQREPLPERVSVAQAELAAAEAAVVQAVARLDELRAGAIESQIAATQAQLAEAQANRFAAYHQHEETMRCYPVTLPGGIEERICPLLGAPEERARFALQTADEEMDATYARLMALEQGADEQLLGAEAAVRQATAQRDAAQIQLETLKAGPTAEEIAAREAAFAEAQAALVSAQTALEQTQVHAPFDGTVGRLNPQQGELVAPGQPLVVLGDLDTLWVETTDLDEIDVALVEVGQPATLTFDALPEAVFSGTVTRISPKADAGGGAVNYTTIIEIGEVHPALRWGMTAFVDIEVE